jgi:RNA 2',3'-cyclic 3'-phosphodiesterase
MHRLFVAIRPPAPVRAHLLALMGGVAGARWQDEEQLHLTLRFIGEVEQGTFYEIGSALAGVSHPPIELRLKGLGQFPPRGGPQTLWAGLEDPDALASLKRRIERAIVSVGLVPERRKFTPHVTLGRFRFGPPEDRFGSWLAGRSLFRSSAFPVSAFGLYSSVLRPEGSLHALEAEYDFVTGVMERA